ncbi:hypothetical protein HB904_17860 [Listeria booriae]|uniref:Uncharacterized protein n=1 Tax=Listeria booriae TaxID=1552123 RepID=A0A842AG64_9LIST|nr:hypothetical protein [Listeria booriae]MBC1618046.1 hypothetical protein [Listeria booriae]
MSYENYIEAVNVAEKHFQKWAVSLIIGFIIIAIAFLCIAISSKMPFFKITLNVLVFIFAVFMVPYCLHYAHYMIEKIEARNTLATSQSKEWQVKEKGDLASLGNTTDTVMSGVFFLGIGKVSSNQERYYAFAKKTEHGIQIKRTDEAFEDILFSDIYIQEKAAESPHYVLEVDRYKDKRVEKVLGSYRNEKRRLTFIVPEKTIKQDFQVDATK